MFTGKAFCSIGVILLLGGILYLFMAARINNGINVRDVVVLQPVPTDESEKKTIPFQVVPQLQLTPEHGAIVTQTVDVEIDSIHSKPLSTENNQQNQPNIDQSTQPTYEYKNKNISVNINKITIVSREQSGDIKSILPKSPEKVIAKNVNVLSDKKIAIIIAYMKTGSTLTASLFQEYPGTFYAFEPIQTLAKKFKPLMNGSYSYTTLHYIHGKERNYTLAQTNDVILDEINSWLTCKLDSLSRESLGDDLHRHYTKIMKVFYYCSNGPMLRYNSGEVLRMHARIHPRLRQYYERSRNFDTCLKVAMTSCQASPLRTLKLLQLRMEQAEKLLPYYPNMKIIHLVRDPRGILNSRIKVKAIAPGGYKKTVNRLCCNVGDDLKHSKHILQQYSDRLKIVHYEDLAENPLETARSLVEFAGLEFLKPMQEYIRKQTSSTRDAFRTQRRNSSITAQKWRTQLDSKYAKYIYEKCKTSNNILGYLPLPTVEALRDKRISSRRIVDVNRELLINYKF